MSKQLLADKLKIGDIFTVEDDANKYKFLGFNTMGSHIIYVSADIDLNFEKMNGEYDIIEAELVNHII